MEAWGWVLLAWIAGSLPVALVVGRALGMLEGLDRRRRIDAAEAAVSKESTGAPARGRDQGSAASH